ncbi:helix-turn-helix domain-containing protein [Rubrobacter xylanophilus]|uniref:helix-turn-helix domain-containing protein n=1 Tax=Rubrobacter xylanophilus TaxID=49319 RepID=UPI001C64449A|nr:helix-turn-helix domain-containing protein [Rubrobacter xylanophilus]
MRMLAGYSQMELAERSGVSRATIAEAEGLRRSLHPRTLRKLAGALGVEVRDLLEGSSRRERMAGGPFTAVYMRDGEWWIGFVEEIPGPNAQERTLDECREALREALEDILEANRELTRTEFEGRDVVREPIGA